jgi:hypothetical protein
MCSEAAAFAREGFPAACGEPVRRAGFLQRATALTSASTPKLALKSAPRDFCVLAIHTS